VRFAAETGGFLNTQKTRAGKERPFRDDAIAQRKKVTFQGSSSSK
jgi:hypothetical protein